MVPILYKTITEGTVPTHYGAGALTDALSCTVKEERNGSYELTMEYAAQGIHAEEIEPNAFIKAKPNYTDDPQIFRIYKVGKTMNGKFTVNASHISYDLSGKVITTGSASSCVGACAVLEAKAGNFTINTDKTASGAFSVSQPSSVRSWFGGKEGSILDIYGPGEWKYDNYTATFMAARGANRGVTIRYGKNLTQLSQVLNMSNLVTGIVPFYVDQAGTVTTGTRVPTGLTLDVRRDLAVDFSSDVDPESSTTIKNQLAALANKYIANNNLTAVSNSITLDFVQLEGLTERVDLCDTVSIYFEALGITATAKCVATTWDVIQERYTKTTFGDPKTNIADTIAKTSKEAAAAPSSSYMAEAITRATELITGNLGGYVVLHDSNGDGEPDEILIMNTADITTATKIWRWNSGGLGYSSNGYAGPYGLAMTSDGEIVADYIKTGTLNANLIKAGVLQDAQGNSKIDMTNGRATMLDFQAKSSLDLINSNNALKGSFYITDEGNTMLFLRSASTTKELVKMWANDANGAGVFQLLKSNGNLILESGLTSEGGGGISIRNSSNKMVGEYRTNAYGGAVTLCNNTGLIVCELNAAPDGDGIIVLRNSSGTPRVWGYGQSGDLVCVTLYQTSSRKTKENIKPIEDAAKILELEAVSFDFKDKSLGTDRRGFIAEDVAEILPNLVKPEEDGRPASLDYLQMVPYLQAVLKEQNERITALEEKIKKLEG